jgi:hypothetical protein
MTKPESLAALEKLGRERLSPSFFMRDFLYSEISNLHGIPNIPDAPDLAIAVGKHLCEELLEPLNATFGRIEIRSAYRSCELNGFGNKMAKEKKAGYNCAENEKNYAHHIWDRLDSDGHKGSTACIVIPWFAGRYKAGADWRSLAYWIHDHLPYSEMEFFSELCAFNLSWHERPKKRISSYIEPKGSLDLNTVAGESHSKWYADFPQLPLR